MFAAFALANLYLLRKRLRPAGRRVSGSTALGKADGPNAGEAGRKADPPLDRHAEFHESAISASISELP